MEHVPAEPALRIHTGMCAGCGPQVAPRDAAAVKRRHYGADPPSALVRNGVQMVDTQKVEGWIRQSSIDQVHQAEGVDSEAKAMAVIQQYWAIGTFAPGVLVPRNCT